MEHTEVIATTHVDTVLTRNLAFTQMGLALLDVILVMLANRVKQVSCMCNIHGVEIAKAELKVIILFIRKYTVVPRYIAPRYIATLAYRHEIVKNEFSPMLIPPL